MAQELMVTVANKRTSLKGLFVFVRLLHRRTMFANVRVRGKCSPVRANRMTGDGPASSCSDAGRRPLRLEPTNFEDLGCHD